jgi:hypothetical protein
VDTLGKQVAVKKALKEWILNELAGSDTRLPADVLFALVDRPELALPVLQMLTTERLIREVKQVALLLEMIHTRLDAIELSSGTAPPQPSTPTTKPRRPPSDR